MLKRTLALTALVTSIYACDSKSSSKTPGNDVTTLSNGSATGVTILASGERHSCAVKGGRVACWGGNHAGQLGLGNVPNQLEPKFIDQLQNVTALSLARDSSCALISDGTVACWGAGITTTPSVIPGLSHVVKIVTSMQHSCALTSEGQVLCWGDNFYGKLGVGKGMGYTTATPELLSEFVDLKGEKHTGFSGVKDIAIGDFHSCALKDEGQLFCWGMNSNGQHGTPDRRFVSTLVPTEVAATFPDAQSFTAGSLQNCVLRADQSLSCWGSNVKGIMGFPLKDSQGLPLDENIREPRSVASNLKFRGLGFGQFHSCAVVDLIQDGVDVRNKVACVGEDFYKDKGKPTEINYGQLGKADGPLTALTGSAHQVLLGLDDVASVAVGSWHSCALTQAGEVLCWGMNSEGQLGNGTKAASAAPVTVAIP